MGYYVVTGLVRWRPPSPPSFLEGCAVGDILELDLSPEDEAAWLGAGVLACVGAASTSIRKFDVEFAFDAPGLFDTGVDLSETYAPQPGDLLIPGMVVIEEDWDGGNGPTVDFAAGPKDGDAGFMYNTALLDGSNGPEVPYSNSYGGQTWTSGWTATYYLATDDPLLLWVGAGGNSVDGKGATYHPDGSNAPSPLPTQGKAKIYFMVI